MRELIVDTFAGGGGASTGIEMALGRSPDIAINHDPVALAMHAANHPATLHLSKNIWQVDPMEVVAQEARRRGAPTGKATILPVGLLWASPDCKHFSKAKGGKPVKRSIRDLAWTVVLWAKRARPRVIILENVEEFRDWGPLIVRDDGRFYPDPERAGETFDRWTGELRRLGYRVEHRELRACDYGAPTIRKRLFLIARRDGQPIVWPEPTHAAPEKLLKEGFGDPADPSYMPVPLKPWRAAAEIIDWSLPCPSIFMTRADAKAYHAATGVRVNRPLAEATMARIARGVKRYVLDAAEPFIVRTDMASAAARNGVNQIGEPLRTQTTAPSHAVVSPTIIPITHTGDVRVNASDEPLRTQTTAHRGEHALVTPFVTKFRANSDGHDAREPLHTITANSFERRPGGAAPLGVVAPYLVPRYGERVGQEPRAASVEAPMPTVVPSGNEASLVSAHLMTMRNAAKPFNEADRPAHTLTAGGANPALVAAFLAQHNGAVVGHDAREPVSTLTAGGKVGVGQQAVVAANLSHAYTSNTAGGQGDPAKPIKTLVTGGHASLIASFLMKYYGEGGQWQPSSDPLHTVTTKDRQALVTVTIDGEPYVIVDIGMRMLTPRERFLAQGFPPDTVIDRGVTPDGKPIAITATDQGRLCGNSVCPPLAAALVRANCADMAVDAAEEDVA